MNERIRECWLKAAREDSGEKWDTQEEFIERFARLIVGGCLDILEDEDTHDVYGQPIRLATIRIKKLFGVEK